MLLNCFGKSQYSYIVHIGRYQYVTPNFGRNFLAGFASGKKLGEGCTNKGEALGDIFGPGGVLECFAGSVLTNTLL